MIKIVQHILGRSLSIWGWQQQMRKLESWHYLLYLIGFVLELLRWKCMLLLQFAICCFTPLLHPLHSRSPDMPLDLRWVPRSCPVLPSATLPDSFCSRVFPCSFLVCFHCCNCTFLPFSLRPARAFLLLLLLCRAVLNGSAASEIRIWTLLLLITGCKFFKGRLCEWITKRTITDWCCVLSLFLSDFSFSTHQDCLHFWDNHTNSIFWSHCHTRYIPHVAQCSFVLP